MRDKAVTISAMHVDLLDGMRGRASRKAYVQWLIKMEELRRQIHAQPDPPDKIEWTEEIDFF